MAVGGALLGSVGASVAATNGEIPRRILGRTKESVTMLGVGTSANGQSSSFTDRDVADHVLAALERGVRYIDSGHAYGMGKAERGIGMVLPPFRKDVFLTTKVRTATLPEWEESFATSLKDTKTDYVDLLYVHNLGDRPRAIIDRALDADGILTWVVKQKKLGKARFVGISGHNLPERFLPLIESGLVDVMMCPINFVLRHVYGFEDKVLPAARKQNMGIVAMKVFGGNRGGFPHVKGPAMPPQMPEEYLELAIRYALSIEGVAVANIGPQHVDHVAHNIAMVKRYRPLSDTEMADALKLGRKLAESWGTIFGPITEPA
jgi:predicted aldo/keto reductase-like oxidoreductase